MLSPAARMVAIGVFSSCVTVETKSDRRSASLRAGAGRAQRQDEADGERHDRRAGHHQGARCSPWTASASVGSSPPPAATVQTSRGRSAGGSPVATSADRRTCSGNCPARSRLLERPVRRAGHARAAMVEHRQREPRGAAADPRDLPGDVAEVVLPHPGEVDREAEDAFELPALRVPIEQARHHLIARAAQRQLEHREAAAARRRPAGCAASASVAATAGSYSTRTGNRFGPVSPGIQAGRRSDRFRKTTVGGVAAAPREEGLRVRIAGEGARGERPDVVGRVQHELVPAARSSAPCVCTPRMSRPSAVTSRSAVSAARCDASSVALAASRPPRDSRTTEADRARPTRPPATEASHRAAAAADRRRHRDSSRSR